MIEKTIVKKRTLLTVVNYGFYQNGQDNKRTVNGQSSDSHRTQNNNDNNDNNINNIYIGDFFEQCWSIYPNKKGKGKISDAKKKKLYKEVGLDQMLRCIERYKADSDGKDKQFVMHGSTFFNSGYVDYLDENYNDGNSAQILNTTGGDDEWQG